MHLELANAIATALNLVDDEIKELWRVAEQLPPTTTQFAALNAFTATLARCGQEHFAVPYDDEDPRYRVQN